MALRDWTYQFESSQRPSLSAHYKLCPVCRRYLVGIRSHMEVDHPEWVAALGRRTTQAQSPAPQGSSGARRAQAESTASTNRRDWSERENVTLVTAYLDLLSAEMHGYRPTKRDVLRKLKAELDRRTRGSIEFKMENVSAVLFEEGLPWIDGYKPAGNFQRALRLIVLGALSDPTHGRVQLEAAQLAVPQVTPTSPRISEFEVEPPPVKPRRPGAVPGARVTRSWKGAVVDAANRRLGRAGEEWICAFERKRLTASGRLDLANRIEWVADTQGDGLGYDVRSFDEDGSELWIEVKTTNSGKSAPFLLTPNELAVWRKELTRYRLVRLYSFSGDPHFYKLSGAPDQIVTLTTALWEARLA